MNILLAFIFLLLLQVIYCKVVNFNDNEIMYFGRWQKTSQDIQSISSGAYLKMTTNSKVLTLRLSQPATVIIQINKGVLYKKEANYEGVFPIELQVDISDHHHTNNTLTFVSDIQSSIHLQSIEILEENHSTLLSKEEQLQDLIEFVGHDLTLGLGTSKSMMTSFPWIISDLLGTERSQIAYKSAWLMNHQDTLGIETLYFNGESFYSPRIVTVLLGEYDQFPSNYTLHLFRFLQRIRHQFPNSILFVLSEPLGVLFHESQEAVHLMNDLNSDQSVYFIDTTGWIRFGTSYYLDVVNILQKGTPFCICSHFIYTILQLHLNDKGQELFANKLAPYLKSKLMNEPFPSPAPNPSLPFHWQTMDIGTQDDIGLIGSVSFDSSQVFTLWGSGYGLDFSDSFRYVYQPLSGPGSITAVLESHTSFDACAKAGIMLREHLAPHAPYVMLGYSPELGLFVSVNNKVHKTQKTQFHQTKLRIQKDHNSGIKIFVNDSLWHSLDLKLARDAYVGLAVTSCNPQVVSVAKFSEVELFEGIYQRHGLIIQSSS